MTVKPSAGTVDSGFAAAGRLDADLKLLVRARSVMGSTATKEADKMQPGPPLPERGKEDRVVREV